MVPREKDSQESWTVLNIPRHKVDYWSDEYQISVGLKSKPVHGGASNSLSTYLRSLGTSNTTTISEANISEGWGYGIRTARLGVVVPFFAMT